MVEDLLPDIPSGDVDAAEKHLARDSAAAVEEVDCDNGVVGDEGAFERGRVS